MSKSVRANRTSWIFALAAGVTLAGCSGSGSSGSQYPTTFELLGLSVTDGQVWQINRPIEITFSQPIDFDTVNQNTIAIQEVGGNPVVGDFLAGAPDVNGNVRSAIFQPVCPTATDYSDAGFRPNGVIYQINLPALATGAPTVRSASAFGHRPLASGHTQTFTTPSTAILSDLFMDTTVGPPTPVVRPEPLPGEVPILDDDDPFCRLLIGDPDAPTSTHYFWLNPSTGAAELKEWDATAGELKDYLAPNNLYSASDTQVTVVLEFNQPVNPAATNVNETRLFLQYNAETNPAATPVWTPLFVSVDLVANCSETGSTVVLTPIGLLPQDRPLRVVVADNFEDMVGDRNTLPLADFALMATDMVVDGDNQVAHGGDEFLEPFAYDDNSFEDLTAALSSPPCSWGDTPSKTNGLQATFFFGGSGGVGGEFDLVIAENTDFVFDTTSTVVQGGPEGVPVYSQLAINGRLDVRNLTIPATSTMRIQGPNPAMVLATGDVTILGSISVNGTNAVSVWAPNTPHLPMPGGAGQGGGGTGGTGSYLTNQVTPRGGNGYGAYQIPNLGGEGGESAWSPSILNNGTDRRCAGGGGGRLGHDLMVTYTHTNGLDYSCFNEQMYGLNAESGFVGADTAKSVFNENRLPYGGHVGAQVFVVGGTEDDFLGTMRKDFGTPSEVRVIGELQAPQPGTGGGAGGDATRADTYPPAELIWVDQDKGAGGGGGAGSLTIRALGDITIGPSGKVTAIGGHGAGGENTSGLNRVGGGSGGGSGGHIILETAKKVKINTTSASTDLWRGIDARGGEGGAGQDDQGGAGFAELVDPGKDAKHVAGPAANDNPWTPIYPLQCYTYHQTLFGLNSTYVIRAAGGDGGPGIVQLHVGNLDPAHPNGTDVEYAGADLFDACWPPPVGYDTAAKAWVDQLLPTFLSTSMTQSTWVPLGAASVLPDENPELKYLFGGTDVATGLVETDANEEVVLLDPIFTASEGDQFYPQFQGSPVPDSAVFALGALPTADGIYERNPNLLRNFSLTVGTENYNVESGELVEDEDGVVVGVKLTVSEGDIDPAAGDVVLRPRYFTVTTDGTVGSLPDTATILIEFQAAIDDDGDGVPDELSDWETDISEFDGGVVDYRFLRYRVTFDINATLEGADATTQRPILNFLRMPFKYGPGN